MSEEYKGILIPNGLKTTALRYQPHSGQEKVSCMCLAGVRQEVCQPRLEDVPAFQSTLGLAIPSSWNIPPLHGRPFFSTQPQVKCFLFNEAFPDDSS